MNSTANSSPARDFALHRVGDELAWMTRGGARFDAHGCWHRRSLRGSLRQRMPEGWRLRFHQGTPTEAPPESS
jgi:hypothetical protein